MRLIHRCAFQVLALMGAAIISCHGVVARETKTPWKIDETTAQQLAAEGQYGADHYLDSFDFDSNSDSFFVFDGLNPPPAEGSFGFFAVNAWTGDVWNLWGCHRLSTPALRRSQAAIRRRFTRDELKQYARLRRLRPECIFGG